MPLDINSDDDNKSNYKDFGQADQWSLYQGQ